MNHVEFEVGERYENMKGFYEVLSINKNTMRIRWDNGEEITTTILFQKRVIERMRREREEAQRKPKSKHKR